MTDRIIDRELLAWDSGHVASLLRFALRPGVTRCPAKIAPRSTRYQTAIYCRLLEGGGWGRERLFLFNLMPLAGNVTGS